MATSANSYTIVEVIFECPFDLFKRIQYPFLAITLYSDHSIWLVLGGRQFCPEHNVPELGWHPIPCIFPWEVVLVVVPLEGLEVAHFRAKMVHAVMRHIVYQIPEPDAYMVDHSQLVVGWEHHLINRFVADQHENYCQRRGKDEPVTKLTPVYGSIGSMWWIPCSTKWQYLRTLLSRRCFYEWKRNRCSRYYIRENENTPNKNTGTADTKCTFS